ncbi:hypothetical protein KXX21_000788 [Aspergillus fumigatus]|nr:hypothetical protein KXX21_000788 [Aspergillus fumigatus]
MKPSSSKVRKPDRRLLVATGKMVQFKHATLTFQLFYVMFSGCMIGGSLWGTGKHLVDLTPEHRARAMEYWFLCDIGYAIASILCKISVAIFLLRVMVHPFHRRIMYAVTALTVIVGIIFFVYMMIQCSPVSYFWTRMLGNTSGKCGYVDAIIILLYLFSASSALFDLTVGLLPILLVRNLQMNQRTKIAVAGLLGMACIASVAIIIRIPFVQTIRDPDFLYATVQVSFGQPFWENTERRQHQFPLGDLESNPWRSPYDPTKSNSQDDRHGTTISAERSGASEFMTESTEQLDGKLPSVPMPSLSKIGVRRTFEISTSQAG